MKTVARAIATAIACALVATACSGGTKDNSSPPVANAGAAQTLLVVGTGNALGNTLDDPLRDDWPRVVYLEAFPRATVFVNAAERDATVASARSRQLPIAQEVKPQTVLVWVGVNDMDHGLSPTSFEQGMSDLLRALAALPDARVLVGDLPAREGDDPSLRAAYNAVIANSARAAGAELVPLSGVDVPGMRTGVDDLGTAAAHRRVADAFAHEVSAR